MKNTKQSKSKPLTKKQQLHTIKSNFGDDSSKETNECLRQIYFGK